MSHTVWAMLQNMEANALEDVSPTTSPSGEKNEEAEREEDEVALQPNGMPDGLLDLEDGGYFEDLVGDGPPKVVEGDSFPEPMQNPDADVALEGDQEVLTGGVSTTQPQGLAVSVLHAPLAPAQRPATTKRRLSWVDGQQQPLCRVATRFIMPHAMSTAHSSFHAHGGVPGFDGGLSHEQLSRFRSTSQAPPVPLAGDRAASLSRQTTVVQEVVNSDMSRYKVVTARYVAAQFKDWEMHKGGERGMLPIPMWKSAAGLPPQTPFRLLHRDRLPFNPASDGYGLNQRLKPVKVALDAATTFPHLEGQFQTLLIPVLPMGENGGITLPVSNRQT